MPAPSPDRGHATLRADQRARVFRRGEHLMTAGEPSEEVFLIASGLVKVIITSEAGRESLVGLYGPGDLLGDIGVISGTGRSAHVIALVTGSAWRVAGSRFLALQDDADVRRLILETSYNRQRKADEQQLRKVHTGITPVAMCLLSWAREFGTQVGDGLELRGVRQKELAQAVGVSVKTVELFLRELRDHGLLRTGRLSYRVPAPDRLADFIANSADTN